MTSGNGFNGFSDKSLEFLSDLRENNNRFWFESHKTDYEKYVVEPAQLFIIAMGKMLQSLAPDIIFDPRTDRTLFRIYRDTRFSKDKTPYKTHIAMFFWEGDGKKLENSGFYFHLEPEKLLLGAGVYIFPPFLLKKYRDAVIDDKLGSGLVNAVEKVKSKGKYIIGEKHYKRVPGGYPQDHSRAEFLLYNGMDAIYETPIPGQLFSSDILDYCYRVFRDMSPLHHWLVKMKKFS
ncbi:DUF2461 domain-containing protein [candidate division KSB1 bacterium]|nr:DUF2461 domain-containing protein [candidate division KSB1 bacterium]